MFYLGQSTSQKALAERVTLPKCFRLDELKMFLDTRRYKEFHLIYSQEDSRGIIAFSGESRFSTIQVCVILKSLNLEDGITNNRAVIGNVNQVFGFFRYNEKNKEEALFVIRYKNTNYFITAR